MNLLRRVHLIIQETALTYSDNKSELEQMMRGIYHGTSANLG